MDKTFFLNSLDFLYPCRQSDPPPLGCARSHAYTPDPRRSLSQGYFPRCRKQKKKNSSAALSRDRLSLFLLIFLPPTHALFSPFLNLCASLPLSRRRPFHFLFFTFPFADPDPTAQTPRTWEESYEYQLGNVPTGPSFASPKRGGGGRKRTPTRKSGSSPAADANQLWLKNKRKSTRLLQIYGGDGNLDGGGGGEFAADDIHEEGDSSLPSDGDRGGGAVRRQLGGGRGERRSLPHRRGTDANAERGRDTSSIHNRQPEVGARERRRRDAKRRRRGERERSRPRRRRRRRRRSGDGPVGRLRQRGVRSEGGRGKSVVDEELLDDVVVDRHGFNLSDTGSTY